MSHPLPHPPIKAVQPITTERPPLRGAALHFIRTVWMALAAIILFMLAISVPARMGQAAIIPQIERMWLEQLGFSPEAFIIYTTALDLLTLLLFIITAALIFWRRSDDWMAVLLSLALLTFPTVITPNMEVLKIGPPGRALIITIIQGIGVGSTLLVFYLFPDGQFYPRWTRLLAWFWVGWLALWAIIPSHSPDISQMSTPARFFAFIFSRDPDVFARGYGFVRIASLLAVILGWFGSGILAQILRYRCNTLIQRQQTKWVVIALVGAFLGYFYFHVSPLVLPPLKTPGLPSLLFTIIGQPIYLILLLLVPLALTISITHYRLWDIDTLINRALVYGVVTGLLGAGYFGVVIIVQQLLRSVTQTQSALVIAVTTLVIAALFMPMRGRVQSIIDRSFYREKVDFRQMFMEFSRCVRTIIDLGELVHTLVERTTEMLHIQYGAVYLLQADKKFEIADAHGLPEENPALPLDIVTMNRLNNGQVVSLPKGAVYKLLVPLIAPEIESTTLSPRFQAEKATSTLVGVLALGPRLSGQDYSREDQALLLDLADQAGTSIQVAWLIEDRQSEVKRREAAEHRLEEYRDSPIGRAETLAQQLITEPFSVLERLHVQAQAAGKDPDAASVLANLPGALTNQEGGRSQSLATLAEGYYYLFSGFSTPELLPVGLRNIIVQLVSPESSQWNGAAEALSLYRRCHSALEANSIAQITGEKGIGDKGTGDRTTTSQSPAPYPLPPIPPFLSDLSAALTQFQPVISALGAYERVDTAQDKLAYLAGAVERLRHIDRFARTELGSADRPLVQRIAESWLLVVTGAMGELQTRAQLACQLLTRHTWQDDIVSLVLCLTNNGRGAALNLRVTIAPDPDYTVVDHQAKVERVAPGEEIQVRLRVRPRLEKGVDQFRARFVILYTDPRGPDQVENFADITRLLPTEGEFQHIPNPYVVGTPLQTGSPLFFGREDTIAFVKENLAALHRNNLVLISQRRTGKTSLLKQLPVRLGDNYQAVYIDGQALGLDPGLPNFFLSLATEIAFALEDRKFEITPPEMSDFADSPAAYFERVFLANVRQAIGERHLLLMLDEFEELESAVRRGDLEPSIFGFLRHLIQHTENLSVIFCGTHRLEELAADYWNVLFNISLYRHIGFLEKTEAMRLIQEPVAPFNMRYDDLALDKIWRVTAGHPYFLQLLCHSLVNQHNKSQHSYITVANVNDALEEILASGEAHFMYLWAESTSVERLVLTALSRMAPLTGQATAISLVDYLSERGVSVERQAIGDALHHLSLRDILIESRESDAAAEIYRWKLGLLGLWVEKYKSLSRVIDENKL